MDLFGRLSLLTAALTTGLMAGLYFAFTVAVMPGLAAASDRTLVETMQRINVAILNGPFALAFAGALGAGALAVVLHLPPRIRSAAPGVLPWLVAGVVLYAVTLGVTFAVNVPLNDALAAAGDLTAGADPAGLDPAGIDPAAVRAAFESRWNTGNLVRTIAATASLACQLVALALR